MDMQTFADQTMVCSWFDQTANSAVGLIKLQTWFATFAVGLIKLQNHVSSWFDQTANHVSSWFDQTANRAANSWFDRLIKLQTNHESWFAHTS